MQRRQVALSTMLAGNFRLMVIEERFRDVPLPVTFETGCFGPENKLQVTKRRERYLVDEEGNIWTPTGEKISSKVDEE